MGRSHKGMELCHSVVPQMYLRPVVCGIYIWERVDQGYWK